MNARIERPSVVAFVTGVLLSVLTALGVVFSACNNNLPDDRRQSGSGGTAQSNGGSAQSESGVGGANSAGGAATGSGGSGGVSSRPYAPSCDEQVCTGDEKCADGPAGTYCVHACPGQLCLPGDAQVSYCTRTGGIICLAQ